MFPPRLVRYEWVGAALFNQWGWSSYIIHVHEHEIAVHEQSS